MPTISPNPAPTAVQPWDVGGMEMSAFGSMLAFVVLGACLLCLAVAHCLKMKVLCVTDHDQDFEKLETQAKLRRESRKMERDAIRRFSADSMYVSSYNLEEGKSPSPKPSNDVASSAEPTSTTNRPTSISQWATTNPGSPASANATPKSSSAVNFFQENEVQPSSEEDSAVVSKRGLAQPGMAWNKQQTLSRRHGSQFMAGVQGQLGVSGQAQPSSRPSITRKDSTLTRDGQQFIAGVKEQLGATF